MRLLAVSTLALLTACTEVQTYGAAAIDQRRVMNDLQARSTMAATCDISLGACSRELNTMGQRYAGLVCGGLFREMLEPRMPVSGRPS